LSYEEKKKNRWPKKDSQVQYWVDIYIYTEAKHNKNTHHWPIKVTKLLVLKIGGCVNKTCAIFKQERSPISKVLHHEKIY